MLLKNASPIMRNSQIYSERFDDIYFRSKEESFFHFVKPVTLLPNWSEQRHFSILETGFGSGLNFFLSLENFNRQMKGKSNRYLHFFSIEKYPIDKELLSKLLDNFNLETKLTKRLIDNYPPNLSGFYNIDFPNCTLTLMLGDVINMLRELKGQFDAIYLDGFDPAKNTSMWTTEVLSQLAKNSKENTLITSFTSASSVRLGLQKVGFNITKTKSEFKKYCLRGIFMPDTVLTGTVLTGTVSTGAVQTDAQTLSGQNQAVCSTAKSDILDNKTIDDKSINSQHKTSITVIGGGIAGCFAGYYLQKFGFKVKILEKEAKLMNLASGNPITLLNPKLIDERNEYGLPSAQSLLSKQSFYDSIIFYQDIKSIATKGVFTSTFNPSKVKQVKKFVELYSLNHITYLTLAQAKKQISPKITRDGYLDTKACSAYTDVIREFFNKKLNCELKATVEKIKYDPRSANISVLIDNNTEILTKKVILSTAYTQFYNDETHRTIGTKIISSPHDDMEYIYKAIVPTKGQITILEDLKQKPKINISGNGYLLVGENISIVGSSWQKYCSDSAISEDTNRQNIKKVEKLIELKTEHVLNQRAKVATRATTKDHIPIIGTIKKDIFINIGHGSRGFQTAQLTARILSAKILGLPYPAPYCVVSLLYPNRLL